MTTWRYIKGSEKDFEGYSDAVLVIRKRQDNHIKFGSDGHPAETDWLSDIIAQRERVTSINDDRLAQDAAAINPKYNRPCKGVTIDVYDVLQAFNVTNPALQHLVKKALAVGQRGHKDKMEDLRDILASAQRAIELEERK